EEFKIDVNLDGIIDKERFKEYVDHWAKLLAEPIPHFRRLAFDIEVETAGGLPDPIMADQRVTSIGLHGTDTHRVFLLRRPEVPNGDIKVWDDTYKQWGYHVLCTEFDSEKEMLEAAFKVIENYPIVLTYNGDLFDVPYLFNRAVKLGISYIPFHMIGNTNATLNMGIHIDMYGIFSNRSLKIYAFKSKYVEDKLDTVSEALLGENKTKYEGDLNSLPLYTLAKYCYNDSRLTYQLSAYNDHMVMKLLVILARISNMPIDDVSRLEVTNWIKSLLYFTHRRNGELIPNSSDFPQVEASTQ
ncbi:MAG: ribonuclease H-like domain-containing protein, partial [Thaumarchaeota archaeon]|nr:ribonuclease H-like domain-containing protein [Nitrososphaerota archaeon]